MTKRLQLRQTFRRKIDTDFSDFDKLNSWTDTKCNQMKIILRIALNKNKKIENRWRQIAVDNHFVALDSVY